MKSRSLILVLPTLLLLSPVSRVVPVVHLSDAPFRITIVDQDGQAAPRVKLTTDNGIYRYTTPQGISAWNDSTLMDRDVYFSIESADYHFPGGGTTLRVARGGRSSLKVQRLTSK
jgi:hypothetical protein